MDYWYDECKDLAPLKAIPKEKIMDCANVLKNVKIQAPVSIGDVVVEDVCGTGVSVIATKNISAA